jgi:hypothetical protein
MPFYPQAKSASRVRTEFIQGLVFGIFRLLNIRYNKKLPRKIFRFLKENKRIRCKTRICGILHKIQSEYKDCYEKAYESINWPRLFDFVP